MQIVTNCGLQFFYFSKNRRFWVLQKKKKIESKNPLILKGSENRLLCGLKTRKEHQCCLKESPNTGYHIGKAEPIVSG
jgi:hypothetical protein